jgi:hypothetical protein
LTEVTASDTTDLDVGDTLNQDALNAILNDDDIRNALFPFVQEQPNHRSAEEADQLVHSIEFQNRLQAIHHAIQQDELKFLLDELNAEKSKCVH